MKITKSVLSILAIAISSSAFASSYPEQIQKHKEEIQAKLNSSTYDVVNSYAYQNIYAGLKSSRAIADPKDERTLIIINSNSNTTCTYKVYSEQESKTVQELSDKLSNIGLGEEVICQTIKAQLVEDRKDSAYVVQLNNVREIDSSLRAQFADSAKNIIGNNLSSDLVVAYLQEYEKKKEILEFNSTPADIPAPKVVLDKKLFALTMFDVNHSPADDSKLAEKIAVLDPKANESIRDGAIQVAADFKAQENAKAISEFNALQEVALKESDPAVKSLIKQAADVKLDSYKK